MVKLTKAVYEGYKMKIRHFTEKLIPFCLLTFCSLILHAGEREFKEIKRFNAAEARQGVAVDGKHVYVVGTREIGKYDKETGKRIAHWQEAETGPIIHLDSGVIVDGKLYCAHSNYPGIPMTSSVEVWDAETLKHIGSHSFGIHWGSCTWVDRHDGYWWAAFAHYEKLKPKSNKGTDWTTVVKFDDHWRYLESWVFPEEVIQKFTPMSNSGGSWGPDGLLYCTGHDRAELYALKLPKAGSVLELVDILPMNNLGQGIAWDRTQSGVIYGIRKKDRQVVVSKLINAKIE
ncbi:MAG: hypothetical protein ACE5IW_05405 [bacterium]